MTPSDQDPRSKSAPPDDLASSEEERRRYARKGVLWSGYIRTFEGVRIDCTVLDLAPSGVKLMVDRPLTEGELVTFVSTQLGKLNARVAWSSHGRVGLNFLGESERVVQMMGNATAKSDAKAQKKEG
jgi:hypothetical protein